MVRGQQILLVGAVLAGSATMLAGCGREQSGTEGVAKRSIEAQGSTFVEPFMSKALDEYRQKAGVEANYNGTGSSAGIKSLLDGTASFAASDAPMTDEEMASAKGKVLNLPLIIGANAVIYNLPTIKEPLKLDGPTLGKIFLGQIKNWNDPAIAATNPNVVLPDMKIVVQVRADGSGSTYVFTDFLTKASPEWKSVMKEPNKKVDWFSGASASPKSSGVVASTKTTVGSITYAELNWAKKSGLGYAAIKNADGQFVLPNSDTMTDAAAAVKLPEDFRVSITFAPGADSYPISSYTYGLVREDLTTDPNGKEIVNIIKYLVTDAQQFAEGLDYAKLPDSTTRSIQEALAKVKTK